MKKAFDQTVRDLKREVNKKVLKVPSIEQKVLDATSNESWGPHGSLLSDIAQATRNYHEFHMIMSIIWKRINDTGKNWRHVYKALVVLDYLVAHGSERVVDAIREHAYQISTLSDFQYIDSSGRDQGNNVRRKSQSLVALVNDKERIQEVRQKAASNRDKFRSNAGNMHLPNSGYGDRYDDDHYEGRYRDDERNGNGRERDGGSWNDDRYGRYGDSYSRDEDRYSRDTEDRYGRESYRDNDYRGRSQSVDDYHHGSRGRSSESYRNAIEDDGQYSSRGSVVKADDHPQDRSSIDKKLDRKHSEKSIDAAPPSYEDAVVSGQSPSYSERDEESSLPPVSKKFVADPSHGLASPTPPNVHASVSGNASGPTPTLESPTALTNFAAQPDKNEVDGEEFDPRSSLSAAPVPSNGAPTPLSGLEMDLLGSLDAYSASSLALVPAGQPTNPEGDGPTHLSSGTSFSVIQQSAFNNQSFDDPFGDGPFKAVPSAESVPTQQNISVSSVSFSASSNDVQDAPPIPEASPSEIGTPSYDSTRVHSGLSGVMIPSSTQLVQQELTSPSLEDILSEILPPAPAPVESQAAYPIPPTQSLSHIGFSPPVNQPLSQPAPAITENGSQNGYQPQAIPSGGFPAQPGHPSSEKNHVLMPAQPMPNTGFANQAMGYTYAAQTGHYPQMAFSSQGVVPQTSQTGFPQAGSMQPGMINPSVYGAYNPHPLSTGQPAAYAATPSSIGMAIQNNFPSQTGPAVQTGQQVPQSGTGITTSQAPLNSSLMGRTGVSTRTSEDMFKTKSSVWADTLSRGLVNLNISGPKANPLADIGVDFDAINRRERRMEKPSTAPVTSTVTMGKAMGTGSGIGRAGAGSLMPPSNPMLGSGMNIGMGGYGVSQPVGRGVPMNFTANMPGNMGLGMNMGMAPGMNPHQPVGFPPGTGGYYVGGAGSYGPPQPPYGGGYR